MTGVVHTARQNPLVGSAADAENGLRGPNSDLSKALRGHGANQGLRARGLESAKGEGIKAGRVDGVDRDAVIYTQCQQSIYI